MIDPQKIKTDQLETLLKIYGALYYDAMGKDPQISTLPRVRKAFNTVLIKYSLLQLYAMVFCHFEWRGRTGENESSFSNLRINGFPIDWLPGNADSYADYMLWVLGADEWANKDGKLKAIIDNWVTRLFSKKTD